MSLCGCSPFSGFAGPAVSDLQTRLEAKGYSVGAPGVDGQFGPLTEGAVRNFQTDQNKNDPAFLIDGIVGPQTWEALCGVNLPGGGGGGTAPGPGGGVDPVGNDSACVSPNKGGWCEDTGGKGPGESCSVGGQPGTYESGLCNSNPSSTYLCCAPNGSAGGGGGQPPPQQAQACKDLSFDACESSGLTCHTESDNMGGYCVDGAPYVAPPPSDLDVKDCAARASRVL